MGCSNIELIKLAKSIIKNSKINDRAFEYDDLVQELILKALVSLRKYKGKAKETSFIYMVMRNHLLNLVSYSEYRVHSRLDNVHFIEAKDFYSSGLWETLTSNEQTIVKDAFLLFENGADLKEIRKQFQIIYKKEWKELRDKVRGW